MKNKIVLSIALLGILLGNIQAQKYFSKTGELSFYSHTMIEDIEAVSNTASTVLDTETGNVQWAVLIKSFHFEKALMQEHFNENYMESSKFPKAKFSGTVDEASKITFDKDGTYTTQVTGELEIHGVTQNISTPVTFNVKNGVISAESKFKVLVADYGIEIPGVVRDNIAKEIEITVKANYEVLEN